MTEQSPTDILAADIRSVDGDHTLGAAELAEKLIELGYTKKPGFDPHPSLKEYKQGEFVEVQKDGRWVAGKVTGIEKGSSLLLYVDSERGPRTVASTYVIRKVAKA